MWDSFDGKMAFITGGSGCLGRALFFAYDQKHSASISTSSRGEGKDPEKTTIPDGDITEPNHGLHEDAIQTLHSEVDLILHAAPSINLIHGLRSTLKNVIHPFEAVAQFGLQCHNLERFVYVSTAYANSHLHGLSPEVHVKVEERIYPLQSMPERTVSAEYNEVQARFSTIEYESNDFPWAYGYLSERLVICSQNVEGIISARMRLTPRLLFRLLWLL